MSNGLGRGRPPKPAAIHRLEGTFRPDKGHTDDNLYAVEKLKCPTWVKGAARRVWFDLAPLLAGARVLTRGDRIALELLAVAYGEWRQANDALEAAGSLTYRSETRSGAELIKSRPEVAIRAAAWNQVRAAVSMFGLDPLSRAKISKQAKEESDPLGEFLPSRRAS